MAQNQANLQASIGAKLKTLLITRRQNSKFKREEEHEFLSCFLSKIIFYHIYKSEDDFTRFFATALLASVVFTIASSLSFSSSRCCSWRSCCYSRAKGSRSEWCCWVRTCLTALRSATTRRILPPSWPHLLGQKMKLFLFL